MCLGTETFVLSKTCWWYVNIYSETSHTWSLPALEADCQYRWKKSKQNEYILGSSFFNRLRSCSSVGKIIPADRNLDV